MRKPPRPPHPIPSFVAPRYGDTPEEDRAFRRAQVLEALTDALVRLLMRQIEAEIEAKRSQARPATTGAGTPLKSASGGLRTT
jgi:hypothetical protein